MKNLFVLFCSVVIFCACASQTQSAQKADKDEPNPEFFIVHQDGRTEKVQQQILDKPNLAQLEAECDKNNAKSCYELGNELFNVFMNSQIESNDSANDKLLNSAKNYLLKSCNLDYGDGCSFYAELSIIDELLKLSPKERKNKQVAVKKLSKNLPTFIQYIQKSCDLNSAIGCKNLGDAYVIGEGVNKNEKLGFSYRKKGCDLTQQNEIFRPNDKGTNCLNVGRMYYNGQGTTKNRTLALSYFLKGCGLWGFGCSDYVGYFYQGFNGQIVKLPQDYEFAFQLAKKGCEMNDGKSCNYLGILYQEGKGTTQDLKRAFWTFSKIMLPRNLRRNGLSNARLLQSRFMLCKRTGRGARL